MNMEDVAEKAVKAAVQNITFSPETSRIAAALIIAHSNRIIADQQSEIAKQLGNIAKSNWEVSKELARLVCVMGKVAESVENISNG